MARQAVTYRVWSADNEGEVEFVYDAWLNSFRTSRYAGVVSNNIYYDTYRNTIEELIARGAVVIVAECKGIILGFACGEEKDGKKVVHYLYTKDARRDVEERLLAALPGEAPGWFTFALHRFLKDKQWHHAPEMARRQKL